MYIKILSLKIYEYLFSLCVFLLKNNLTLVVKRKKIKYTFIEKFF